MNGFRYLCAGLSIHILAYSIAFYFGFFSPIHFYTAPLREYGCLICSVLTKTTH